MSDVNLHLYPSNFEYESRILKETKSLIDSGLVNRIFILAIWKNGLKVHEQLDKKREVWRISLKANILSRCNFRGIFQYIEWMAMIFIKFKKEHVIFINCHSLSTLPLGIVFKIFIKSKVIYDTHELETERNGWSDIKKMIAKLLERILIYYVDSVIVVSNSIAEWYKNKYSLKKIYIVRNIPYKQNIGMGFSNVLKEKCTIRDDEILFIYQGLLDNGRGIKILLSAFSKVDRKKHIVFMGYGILENVIKEYENNFSNIHFQPAVKPDKVIIYTKSADVGISLIENTCLSYQYSLPNKMFEYILSGLPLIVSDFPDMGEIIDNYKCGWKIVINEESIIELIENISRESVEEKRNNVLKCRDIFDWRKEEKNLLKAYYD